MRKIDRVFSPSFSITYPADSVVNRPSAGSRSSAIIVASLPLRALEAEGWIILPHEKQDMLQQLVTDQRQLIDKLVYTYDFTPQSHHFFNLLAKLADNENTLKTDRTIRYVSRTNQILETMLHSFLYYEVVVKHIQQRTLAAVLPKAEHLLQALALQELIFLEVHLLDTSFTAPCRYQDLITLNAQLLGWKALNHWIDTFLHKSENPVLFRVSIWYQLKEFCPLPVVIEPLDHQGRTYQEISMSIKNAAMSDKHHSKKLQHHLYRLSCWKYYLLTGYKSDPMLSSSPLKEVCQQIQQTLKLTLKVNTLPDSWPLLDEKLEVDLFKQFSSHLYPNQQ